MKGLNLGVVLILLMLAGCSVGGVNYTKALFEHVPEDPELLVLVRPNDIARLAEMAVDELQFGQFFKNQFQVDAAEIDHYMGVLSEMLKALGVPWEDLESVGFMLYFKKPVLLITGTFKQDDMIAKMRELGFRQHANSYFDYVYGDQKLNIAADGLMIFAEEELLDDLALIPVKNRLWNRSDFKQYRQVSPLNNTLFVWTDPPDDFLEGFKYRDTLGDLSFALDLKSNVTFQANIRMNSAEETAYLADIILGTVTLGGGMFGSDPDYGPVLKAIKVSHIVSEDQKEVTASLVIPPRQVKLLKQRIIDDINNQNNETFSKWRSFFEKF